MISAEVAVPPGFEIADQSSASTQVGHSVPSDNTSSSIEREYAEWIKASRAVALDYCKTMMTASTGAVPVYFALLKYLGHERSTDNSFSALTVIAPVLFLAAALLFAFALTPTFGQIAPAQFADFRDARLGRLNLLLRVATVLFAVGMLLTVVIAFGSLNRS